MAALTKMKDSQRLDLLKEIAGTRIYDERRKESVKIMAETKSKSKQIDVSGQSKVIKFSKNLYFTTCGGS